MKKIFLTTTLFFIFIVPFIVVKGISAGVQCVVLYDFHLNMVGIDCVKNDNWPDETWNFICFDAECGSSSAWPAGEEETGDLDDDGEPESNLLDLLTDREPEPEDTNRSSDHGGMCNGCHVGYTTKSLLKQSNENTAYNHKSLYYPKLGLKLKEGTKKHIGYDRYLVNIDDQFHIQDKRGKNLKTFPRGSIVLTDLIGKPVAVFLGIKKKADKKSK